MTQRKTKSQRIDSSHSKSGKRKSAAQSTPPRREGPNSNLIAWGEEQIARGMSIPLVIQAQEAACTAGILAPFLSAVEAGGLADLGPPPTPDAWERMYIRSDRVFEKNGNIAVPDVLRPGGSVEVGLGTALRHTANCVRALRRMDPDDLASFIRGFNTEELHQLIADAQKAMRDAWEAHVEELRQGFEDNDFDMTVLESDEVQFFLRVWWPCWTVYGEGAGTLFELARTGDVAALEKLVRIDKRILQIPRIVKWIAKWQDTRNAAGLRVLGDAIRHPNPLKSSAVEQKMRTIAFLFAISRQFEEIKSIPLVLLRVNDLRNLFDAVARDQGRLRDEDLPESDGNFRKSVYRMREKVSLDAWDIYGLGTVP